MPKNIILCSDGTGNKGGYGADTNVYKLYNAIDIHNSKTQITFYDDGVGTNTNKYIRGVTGAFGFGFGKNIRELYAFLSRNYDPGDEIFMFGFSRGAATVRAFAGMIQECGLLDIENGSCKTDGHFDEKKFQTQVEKAFKAYRKIKSNPSKALEFKKNYAIKDPESAPDSNLKIKMIGVWDTVSALGFPQDWSWIVNWIFYLVEKLGNLVRPHSFYNYQLNQNVEHVHHAIAIDDERKTFHPKVWTETVPDKPKKIEQVWFVGVHSNVGGGYPRAGLSLVAYDWMVKRAVDHGLVFKKNVMAEAEAAANVYGKLYDSRDGAAVYYRYAPRNIEELCEGRLNGPVKIHKTVIDRMKARTLGYAPEYIPGKFELVYTPVDSTSRTISWDIVRSEIDRWVNSRKVLYRIFVEATVALIIISALVWGKVVELEIPEYAAVTWESVNDWGSFYTWLIKHLLDIFKYFLPEFLEPFITYAMLIKPYIFLGILTGVLMIYLARGFLREGTQRSSEDAREKLLNHLYPKKEKGEES